MTAIMGLAVLYFILAQNRWSWHLIGRRHTELEVRSAYTVMHECMEMSACMPAAAARERTVPCLLALCVALQEALPQPPPAGLPWDWHRRPHGGPSIATRRSLLEKRSGEIPLHSRSSTNELVGGGGHQAI